MGRGIALGAYHQDRPASGELIPQPLRYRTRHRGGDLLVVVLEIEQLEVGDIGGLDR